MEYMDIETVKELDHVFGDIEELQKFRCLMMQYECAMLEVKTKLDVLNTELSVQNSRNPIESIKCRIKEPDSIMKKMKRQEIPFSVDNIEKNLNDIAGVRVICSFPDDIYTLADYLEKQDDIKLIKKKDYISHPKPNGYRSLHLILEVPIFLTNEKKMMRVEVQFRTLQWILGELGAQVKIQKRYRQCTGHFTGSLLLCGADLTVRRQDAADQGAAGGEER